MNNILKKIDIYADGADEKEIIKFNKMSIVKGLTTNPSLMKKSGVKNYINFCKKILKKVKKPISFEIFADEENEILRQARIISKWGKNVYVKIPIVNTKNISLNNVIKTLSNEKINLNITAIFTKRQIKGVINSLNSKTPAIISIFCGRIADAGVNPSDFIQYANKIRKNKTNIKILWASTREIYNIIEAQNAKSDIITVPTSILNKLNLIGKNLDNYSVETVRMFYDDAKKAGYKL
jgi:transaldolase